MKKWRKKSSSPLLVNQEAVMSDYAASLGLLKKRRAKEHLHMFFSPWRVATGMTDEEAAICVALHPLREAQMDKDVAEAGKALEEGRDFTRFLTRTYLPEEFRPDRVMTRARFKRGLFKFLLQVAKE